MHILIVIIKLGKILHDFGYIRPEDVSASQRHVLFPAGAQAPHRPESLLC